MVEDIEPHWTVKPPWLSGLRGLSTGLLRSAWVVISGSWAGAPRQALHSAWGLLVPLPLPPTPAGMCGCCLSLSL